MKVIPLLLFCLVLCFSACKKDTPASAPAPNPAPVVVDYRDTVQGTYIGTMHHVHLVQMSTTVTLDTLYTDTLTVALSSLSTEPDIIYINGQWATLRTNYTIGDDHWHYVHGGVGGSFSFSAQSADLHFTFGNSWNGIADNFEFTGTKQ